MADKTNKGGPASELEHTTQARDVENAGAVASSRQHLSPVPSNDPADPLNWPMALKIVVLTQVALLAALGGLNTAIINPAYVPLAKEFGITTVQAGYQTTVVIAINGIAPFLWIPLANVYGRRPVYLASTLVGFVSAIGCAYTRNFGQLIVARVFNGFITAAFALGAASVVDLFFFHQRGRAMGFYTVMMTNGSHLAPIVGGLVGQYLGWRWTFKFAAILDGVMFLITFFCLPETLYVRENSSNQLAEHIPLSKTTYLQRLKFWGKPSPKLHLRAKHFILPPLRMARYPSALFPALYYAAQYGFASILPAVTVAHIFTQFFRWNTLDIGLAYGGALTIGGTLGELAGGLVVDYIVKRERKRLGRDPEPEVRLQAIWTGEILLPIGLLIYGFTLQYHTHWFGPLFGMGLACFGIQIITTTCYTYSIDSYRPEGSDVSQLFNFCRQEIGMTFAFYAIPMAEKIGYQFTFLFFALMGSFLAFIPIAVLMWKGKEIREKLGKPNDINAIDETENAELRASEAKLEMESIADDEAKRDAKDDHIESAD
ncbi:MFS general substrate transporter [Rhizodiscina lignyota]|uniref:MFS general substrate transporter n=1 Tax=Rhizodiscina lignyota TaxID=1504668 RepID=A0A9P4M613_9PEZI|nr:MFS general substrate transporter [Rhizodiscina lignyota]